MVLVVLMINLIVLMVLDPSLLLATNGFLRLLVAIKVIR